MVHGGAKNLIMQERDGDAEYLLPPAAKRKKFSGEGSDSEEQLRERESTMLPMAEFPASSLDDFYKPCPSYRLPLELGAFSFNDKGEFCHDRSQLRYYSPPSQTPRLALDLKVGYEGYEPKPDSGVAHVEPILKWISLNGHCFRPRSDPLSPNNGAVSTSTKSPVHSPTSKER